MILAFCVQCCTSSCSANRRIRWAPHSHANFPGWSSSSLSKSRGFPTSSSSASPKYARLSSSSMHSSCIHHALGPNDRNSVFDVRIPPISCLPLLFMHFQQSAAKQPLHVLLGLLRPQK